MNNSLNFSTNFEELVFASRNKEYGAYNLRKSYKANLTTSMWIAILISVLTISGSAIYRLVIPEEEIREITKQFVSITLDQIPSIKKKLNEVEVKVTPVKPTIKFTQPVVRPDELVQDESVPTIDELTNADIGDETINDVTGDNEFSFENGNELVVVDEVKKPVEFVKWADEMPEVIGGTKSIMEKITYPEIAKRALIEGRVIVLAFVDENGDVTKAELIKGIGAGCDETALDAVLNTKFKPGRQRGNNVKVQVTIPIIFKLQ